MADLRSDLILDDYEDLRDTIPCPMDLPPAIDTWPCEGIPFPPDTLPCPPPKHTSDDFFF